MTLSYCNNIYTVDSSYKKSLCAKFCVDRTSRFRDTNGQSFVSSHGFAAKKKKKKKKREKQQGFLGFVVSDTPLFVQRF